jgi:hypothetical protein
MLSYHPILSDPKKRHDLVLVMLGHAKRLKIWFSFSNIIAFRIDNGSFMFNGHSLKLLGKETVYHKNIIISISPSVQPIVLHGKEFQIEYNQALTECILGTATEIATNQLFPKKEVNHADCTV